MLCFIREAQNGKNVAGQKARNDAYDVLKDMGIREITLPVVLEMNEKAETRSAVQKIRDNLKIRAAWKQALSEVRDGDTVIVQFPVLRHPLKVSELFEKAVKRQVKVVLLIHDLDAFRYFKADDIKSWKKKELIAEETRILKLSSQMIVHNRFMHERMVNMGYPSEKLIDLNIFDYLIPGSEKLDPAKVRKDGSVVIAGSLNPVKVGYISELPDDCEFNLYGIGYQEQNKPNIHYQGSFRPDEIPFALSGSFGLVWDGSSKDTCSGIYGEYLRINNPHKTSLYLATGLPVIVWKNAAIAEFVEKHHCGIAVESLDDIAPALEAMTEEEYEDLLGHVREVSGQLRSGYYTRAAVGQIRK